MAPIVRWLVRLMLALALAVGLGYLPYRAYGNDGVGRVTRLKAELRELAEGNLQLQHDNQRLRQQIERLKKDDQAIRRVARDEFGLVADHDVVIQFD